jgi:hypothetical protein
MRSNLTDLDVVLHHETKMAYLVSTDGDRDSAVWVPKSLCELVHKDGRTYEMTLEQSVAEDKGLV